MRPFAAACYKVLQYAQTKKHNYMVYTTRGDLAVVAKRQYLLTFLVSRYFLLALHGSMSVS